MSLFKDWKKLTDEQNETTFNAFWEKYCDAEKKLYGEILKDPGSPMAGSFDSLSEKYGIEPTLFMGFLDGISDSLTEELGPLEDITGETELSLTIDPEKLYFNMHAAKAEHLYTLEAWDGVLSAEDRERIAKEYKRSRTVVKEKKPGRNEPCPCGSGKKYKHCCGKN